LTFGAAGSNHALATAIYSKKVGLNCISMLMPQPNSRFVRKNLLRAYMAGAELHYNTHYELMSINALTQMILHKLKTGQAPMMIPPGGSSSLGSVGFVNAAFELKEQIENNLLPEPDFIYVAMGTAGTSMGLKLGLRAAGLKTRVIPVRVVDELFCNDIVAKFLYNNINNLLHNADTNFPFFPITPEETRINNDCFGEGYGQFTPGGNESMQLLKEKENIEIEGTYTAKAFSAILKDRKKLSGKTVLFWNTYNAVNFDEVIEDVDYHNLPQKLHIYFEENY
ncbi:MAG: pyridoxal-phosphate dependent enzyme, partial [Vulcanimicrobiota bacterium]